MLLFPTPVNISPYGYTQACYKFYYSVSYLKYCFSAEKALTLARLFHKLDFVSQRIAETIVETLTQHFQ